MDDELLGELLPDTTAVLQEGRFGLEDGGRLLANYVIITCALT